MPIQPTRAELAGRFGEFERVEGRRDLIATGLFLGALFANIPLLNWLEKTPGMWWIAAAALVAEFGAAFAYNARSRARYREAEVCCPLCGAVFARPADRQLVVATGTCARCSAAIARDAEAGASAVVGDAHRAASPWRYLFRAAVVLFLVAGKVDVWSLMFAARRPADMPYLHASGPPVGVTVQEAAARIAAVGGRPSIVILYGVRSSCARRMFSAFAAMAYRHPEVEVLAFGSSESSAAEIPAFLREHRADFAPLYLHDWPEGDLSKAMAPLGIRVDSVWSIPLVAIRDANGFVVMQGDAMTDVRSMERVLARLRQP